MVEYLLWFDLETTGSKATSTILEFAAVLTTNEYVPLVSAEGTFPKPSYQAMSEVPGIVLEMHHANDLWKDCEFPHFMHPHQADADVAEMIYAYFNSIDADNPVVRLAGSGVSHFDSLLMVYNFPMLWKMLHGFEDSDFLKPTLDMGVIRRFLKFNNLMTAPETFDGIPGKPHRAMYDVLTFIEQAKWYKNHLMY